MGGDCQGSTREAHCAREVCCEDIFETHARPEVYAWDAAIGGAERSWTPCTDTTLQSAENDRWWNLS